MIIEEKRVDNVVVLSLKGKMTLDSGDLLLKERINALILRKDLSVLVDMKGVPYIDNAGLGQLVRSHTTVSRLGGKLKILNLTKRIMDLLALTRLLTVFEVFDDEESAIASFSAQKRVVG